MAEFADFDAYGAWMKKQPSDVVIAIAARSALRSAPYLFDGGATESFSLAALWAVIVTAVKAAEPNADMAEAYHSAAFAAQSAAESAPRLAKNSATELAPSSNAIPNNVQGGVTLAINAAQSAAQSAPQSAFLVANSTALSAAAIDSEFIDSGSSARELLATPLWRENSQFDRLDTNAIRAAALADPIWSFWARWYDGMLHGRPIDWHLQERVALIPYDEWKRGPERIAEIIEGIEEEFYRLGREQAQQQVHRLRQKPRVNTTIATGLSKQIQIALDEYRRTVSNALPDALEPLERLPGLLDTTANALLHAKPADDIVDLVIAMAATVADLNRRLKGVHRELASRPKERSAKSYTKQGFFVTAGVLSANALFSPGLWGYLVAGMSELLGPVQAPQIESLGKCYEDLIGPDAICPPEMWDRPELYDV